MAPKMDLSIISRAKAHVEQAFLKRAYAAPRMKATKLDLKLDMSMLADTVRAEADLWFRPQTSDTTMICLIGEVTIKDARCKSGVVKARTNSPFLVLDFPKRLEAQIETQVIIRYAYKPDFHWTVQQPITPAECPEKLTITCRRPLLGVVQGKLLNGEEKAPFRTYTWQAPRSRRLNAFPANVESFKKTTPSGMEMWLHCQPSSSIRAPRLLDLCVQIYEECTSSHHVKLPYTDFHVVEGDDPRMPPFNSWGMIVVPRGTFETDDRPRVYGVLAPEFNKEWRRDPTLMVAEGKRD